MVQHSGPDGVTLFVGAHYEVQAVAATPPAPPPGFTPRTRLPLVWNRPLTVARDGTWLGSWTDTTPLASGAYLALRTDSASVQFDDVAVSAYVKYYELGGTRVALRNAGGLSYLLGDHLGSTHITASPSGTQTGALLYQPWGGTRYASGMTPTSYRYTGQREEAAVGLYYYGARWYDPAIGRFLQPDTLVPDPANSQSLNRYAYTYNSPLVYADPSGHAPQGPNDADDNPAPCGTDWCWQNRWYRAHGYSWGGGGWSLDDNDGAVFYDAAILQDTMGELGIQFQNLGVSWHFPEMTLVAQGVVALANRMGGFGRLGLRLPHGAVFLRSTHGWSYAFDPQRDPPAQTLPQTNLVFFANSLFAQAPDFIRGTAVHELAHVIDYFNPFANGTYISQLVPMGTHISDYAIQNGFHLEYWAEMVAAWVYGKSYQNTVPTPNLNQSLTVDQASWIEHVLGWGW